MTDFNRQLEEAWGPAATHSEYTRGDIIRYNDNGVTQQGTIIWITAAGAEPVQGEDPLPLRYIVEPAQRGGFPDVVYQSDILSSEASQEPVLIRCPYCPNYHSEGNVEYCPFNPNRKV